MLEGGRKGVAHGTRERGPKATGQTGYALLGAQLLCKWGTWIPTGDQGCCYTKRRGYLWA